MQAGETRQGPGNELAEGQRRILRRIDRHRDHLVQAILRVCGDAHSTGNYRQIVAELPEPEVWSILEKVRQAIERDPENTHPGKFFTFLANEKRATRA